MCPLCIYVCLLAFLTNWTSFKRNPYQFCANFVRTSYERMFAQVCEYRSLREIRTNLVQICANFIHFVYRLRSVSPMVVASTLPLPQRVPHTPCLVRTCPSTRGPPEVRQHGRNRFTPHHRVQLTPRTGTGARDQRWTSRKRGLK